MMILPVGLYNSNPHIKQSKSYMKTAFISSCSAVDSVNFRGNINNETARKIIILIGAPNSGKGTTARALSKHYSIPYIGAGDILRDEIKKGNKFSDIAKQFMEKIGTVPKYTQLIKMFIYKTLREKLKLPAYKNGFVLEGFPRSVEDADILKNLLDSEKNTELKIIHLNVQKPLLFERSANRFMCRDCNKTFSFKNVVDIPKCSCGGTIVKRDDDTPEILERRIKKYERETVPVIDYYGDKVIEVQVDDNNTTKEDVLEKIISAISG